MMFRPPAPREGYLSLASGWSSGGGERLSPPRRYANRLERGVDLLDPPRAAVSSCDGIGYIDQPASVLAARIGSGWATEGRGSREAR